MVKEYRDAPPRPGPRCITGSNPLPPAVKPPFNRKEPTISQENTIDRLTLRDQFAISALQGLCAANSYALSAGANLAKKAYFLADAMLEERKNGPKK